MKTKQQIEDIEKVWKKFRKDHDDESRNKLIEYYYNTVKCVARSLHIKFPKSVELDDLISDGVFGLMDALNSYDPSRGVKFESWCSPRIRGSILDAARRMKWTPRIIQERVRKLTKVTDFLEASLGRKPNEEEIAEELKVSEGEFEKILRDVNTIDLVPLNNKNKDGEEEVSEMDFMEDKKSENPLIEVQKRDLKNLLTRGFTRTERLILVFFYYEEMSMKEIGEFLRLSENRIRQIRFKAVARLKDQMNITREEFAIG